MPHLERAAVAAVVLLVGILLAVALYWTGEVTRSARSPSGLARAAETLRLETPAWDLSRPLPEPAPLGPGDAAPAETIPVAGPERGGEVGAEAGAVLPGEGVYEVREGDRLETIALRELGSRREVEAILRANPGLDRDRIRAGDRIAMPAKGAKTAAAGKPEATEAKDPPPRGSSPKSDGKTAEGPSTKGKARPRTYVVRKGDTLWSLATRLLGDGKRWREIVARNPSVFGGGRELPEGATLELP